MRPTESAGIISSTSRISRSCLFSGERHLIFQVLYDDAHLMWMRHWWPRWVGRDVTSEIRAASGVRVSPAHSHLQSTTPASYLT